MTAQDYPNGWGHLGPNPGLSVRNGASRTMAGRTEPRSAALDHLRALVISPGSGAVRPAILLGFGVLLGWSASSMRQFYAGAPSPIPVQAVVPKDGNLPSAAAPVPPPAGTAAPSAPSPSDTAAPPLALLGGQIAPDGATLFCSLLMVNPRGCTVEARLAPDGTASTASDVGAEGADGGLARIETGAAFR